MCSIVLDWLRQQRIQEAFVHMTIRNINKVLAPESFGKPLLKHTR